MCASRFDLFFSSPSKGAECFEQCHANLTTGRLSLIKMSLPEAAPARATVANGPKMGPLGEWNFRRTFQSTTADGRLVQYKRYPKEVDSAVTIHVRITG